MDFSFRNKKKGSETGKNMCEFDGCEEGPGCEGSFDGTSEDPEANHHCEECGRLFWVDKMHWCDLCESIWCGGCFDFGGSRDELLAHERWEEVEGVVLKLIGDGECFCSDCFEKISARFE